MDNKEILYNFIHEVGTINQLIRRKAEILSKVTKKSIDKKSVAENASLILEHSAILSTQIDLFSYQLNPDLMVIEKKDMRNLYGKFYKAVLAFKQRAKEKDVKLNISGDQTSLIELYPVIDTLPILILDNAIKYSHKGSDIDITIEDDDSTIIISCENTGPHVYSDEVNLLFDRGKRGINAIESGVAGMGLGLSFLKHICNIHNAKYTISISNNTYEINDMEYSQFKLTLIFPKKD